ncbi:MAG: YbaN family protein [Armatimonadaceae bacterium]|jgi:uncharacterized membrane protein YbaN (DUF454 family)
MTRAQRWLLLAAGHTCVGIALAGAVLPLVPSTPFLLLAAACYVRSSEERYRWLTEHPVMGAMIRDFRGGNGIGWRTRITLIVLTWTWAASIAWRTKAWQNTKIGIPLAVFALVMTVILCLFRRPKPTSNRSESVADDAPDPVSGT